MKRVALPSAHDVAHLAGVSQAAVSRAFTPGASIAQETRSKVLRAAKSLGYRPNLLARSLIKGESGMIGVVMGYPRNAVVMSALDSLLTRLSQAGKHILVFAAEDAATADVHAEELLKYRVDALILIASNLSPKLEDLALATIEVARYEFSLEVGREVGIAGFDDTPQAAWRSFDLTSYSLPVAAMIDRIMVILLSTPRVKQMVHGTIEGSLKPRSSTQRRQK